jgi:hypothetical protein
MDPNPFKHPAIILAKTRDAIEPSLDAAGFSFDTRNKPPVPIYLYLDYTRSDGLFRLSWDRRDSNNFIGFVAELILESDGNDSVTSWDLSYTAKLPRESMTVEIEAQIASFADSVKKRFDELAST